MPNELSFNRLKDVDIKANIGNRVYIVALALGVEVRPMKIGGESIIFKMVDNDEEREVRVFDNVEIIKSRLVNGQVYDIVVDIKPYDKGTDGLSCILYDIRATRYGLTPEQFRPHIDNIEVYEQKLLKYLNYYSQTVYSAVALHLYRKVREQMLRHPAGASMHHTEIGGLLFHEVAVADMCYAQCVTYNTTYGEGFVNDALTVCTALIHDIGKLQEFKLKEDYTVEYTPLSAMTNHIVIGTKMIRQAAIELGYGDIREIDEMEHLLLSHHGKMEYGSPVEPHCLEAIILSEADINDARAWRYRKALRKLNAGESLAEWARGTNEIWYKPTSLAEHIARVGNGFQDVVSTDQGVIDRHNMQEIAQIYGNNVQENGTTA